MSRRATGQEGLLLWTQTITSPYNNVNVTDFTYSWENGLAFCALVHAFHPEKIPWSELKAENKEHNLKLAFDAAAEVGVPALMDPEDMLLSCGPDRFSVVTYLSQFFHKFKDFGKNKDEDKPVEPPPQKFVDKDEEVRKRREMLDKVLAKPERKCSKCGGGLSQGTIVEALGKHFHTTCFVCASCNKPFSNNKFMNVDGDPFCAPCGKKAFSTNKNAAAAAGGPAPYTEDNPKCAKCGELCGGDTIDAIGQAWHPKCFVCETCSRTFVNGRFLNVDNKPYCEQCGRRAFISTRLPKPVVPPSSPQQEHKPATPFQTPGGLSKSKSMFAVTPQAKPEAPASEPDKPAPRLASVSGSSLSSRLSMFQQKEDRSVSPSSGGSAGPDWIARSRGNSLLSPQGGGNGSGPISVDKPKEPLGVPVGRSPALSPAPVEPPGARSPAFDAEERKARKAEEEAKKKKEMEEREAKRKEIEELEKKQKEEQRKKREDEKLKKKQQEEEKKKKEAEEKEAKRIAEEEQKKKKSEEKRKQMEEQKKKKDEEDSKKKQEQEEEEAKKKEEKAQRADAAKKKREEMKKLVEDEEARKLAEKEQEKNSRKKVFDREDIKSPDITTNLVLETKNSANARRSTSPAPVSAAVFTTTTTTTTSAAVAPIVFNAAVSSTIVHSPVVTDLKLSARGSKELNGAATCPAADVMCAWSGTHASVQAHAATCHFVALRPVLSFLLKQNHDITQELQELKKQFANKSA